MSCIAVGNFDGVHKGHVKILDAAVRAAEAGKTSSSVITFSKNTKSRLGAHIGYLTDNEYKRSLITAVGIENVFFLDFNDKTASLSGEAFISLLEEDYGLTHIFCGDNFRFAKNAACGTAELRRICALKGIDCTVIPTDGISSTAIRQSIAAGRLEEASAMLGRDYSYSAPFVSGNHIGRTIGYPTLNQPPQPGALLPPNGVYVTYCLYGGRIYPAVTNIGTRPTVSDSGSLFSETYLLSVSGLENGIPGDFRRIFFKTRIRGERKFPSLEALKQQISKDCEFAQNYFC